MKAKDLKNSILQMAVEGKLVPQDHADEPASKLLERIREEKHKLIAEGKAKFPKGSESIIYIASDGSPYEKRLDAKGRVLSDECIAGEVPFEELPEGWAWVRLGTICRKLTDGSHNPPPKRPNGYPVISATNISNRTVDLGLIIRYCDENGFQKENPRTQIKQGDIVLGIIGGSIGNVGIFQSNKKVIAQRSVAIIDSIGCNSYLSWALESPLFNGYYKNAVGTAQGGIYLQSLSSMFVPLPPMAEQHRIVEHINQLMPLVEEYGELEDAREELDAALPSRLRKSVLQMAVQGKLVSQDPADESASALLERIREQRRKLIAEKKMKAPKGGESVIFRGSDGRRYEKRIDAKGRESEPACIEDEIPFEIPDGWEWARLSSIASFGGGKTPSTNDRSNYAKDGVLWVTSKDMKKEHIDSTQVTLSEKGASELTLYPKGCIVMVTRSGILRRLLPVAILGRPSTVNQDQKVVIPNDSSLSEWLLRFFQGSDQRIRSDFGKDGTTVESIVFDKIRDMLIAIPPLAEQKRIDACLKELIPLITNQ